MPTIKARRQANGVTRYTAIVRIRRGGVILHRESRTFSHRSAAITWGKHREVALEDPTALTCVQQAVDVLELRAGGMRASDGFRSHRNKLLRAWK